MVQLVRVEVYRVPSVSLSSWLLIFVVAFEELREGKKKKKKKKNAPCNAL